MKHGSKQVNQLEISTNKFDCEQVNFHFVLSPKVVHTIFKNLTKILPVSIGHVEND